MLSPLRSTLICNPTCWLVSVSTAPFSLRSTIACPGLIDQLTGSQKQIDQNYNSLRISVWLDRLLAVRLIVFGFGSFRQRGVSSLDELLNGKHKFSFRHLGSLK